MTAAYSGYRSDGVTAALGIHLIVYCVVGACFAFGLYVLLQPSRGSQTPVWRRMNLPRDGDQVWHAVSDEKHRGADCACLFFFFFCPDRAGTGNDGSLTPQPELKPTVTAPARPRIGKRPNREVRGSPKPRGAACIPAYDSSGAQTRPCG